MEDRCLVMFAKFPERGQVKSRLTKAIGEEKAAELYRCFIEDLLERLSGGNYRFQIAFYPAGKEHEIKKMLGNVFCYMPQVGGDLGERMKNAFSRCFSEGPRSVVVIGSDIPDLPAWIIEEAFFSLDDHDAVIGPSVDGGYYLIGFRKETFNPDIFAGPIWGTEDVFRQTMTILQETGALVYVLPIWQDIDKIEDIAAFIEKSEKTEFTNSKTMQYLRGSGLT
ncbi:MAG TPA: TIGR04282 family arsenosugar biosynthesis glycosyltransferase [Syntrophales bacterium]|nr:TIGR04282 family arsenosugar biosynthesis glycosyltransferase [Syntrophales bacterium]